MRPPSGRFSQSPRRLAREWEVGDAILAINGEAVSSKGEVVRRVGERERGPGQHDRAVRPRRGRRPTRTRRTLASTSLRPP